MQAIEIRRTAHGKSVVDIDRCGAVFAPAPGASRPLEWEMGPPMDGTRSLAGRAVYTCPQSAIPQEVWQLLSIWWQCHTLGTLPKAGGLADQPVIVRRAWPVFEREFQVASRVERLQESQVSGAALSAAMMAASVGGGKRAPR